MTKDISSLLAMQDGARYAVSSLVAFIIDVLYQPSWISHTCMIRGLVGSWTVYERDECVELHFVCLRAIPQILATYRDSPARIAVEKPNNMISVSLSST